jgi:hypothetical protein
MATFYMQMFLSMIKAHDIEVLVTMFRDKMGVTELPEEVESKLRLYLQFAQAAATDLTKR